MLVGTQLFESLNDSIILDSLSFINKYIDEYVELSVRGSVSLNTNLKEIYRMGYPLYKNYIKMRNIETGNIEGKISVMHQLLMFSLIPMMNNLKIITDEFSSKSETNTPMWVSIMLLLLCIFIGYMLFRIILMRFFDKKSLEPNPRMSQSDLDKLYKELANCKKEINLFEVNLYAKSMKIEKLQKELANSTLICDKDKELIMELEKVNRAYIEEIALLKQQIQTIASNKDGQK